MSPVTVTVTLLTYQISLLVQDMVIGIVMDKCGEDFRVDIRAPSPGILPSLTFEWATKFGNPKLEVYTLVYCRVTLANRDMQSELSCISSTYKKGWMTGQTVFGELKK
jgi:exosome complex component RRP40